jgi:hypothetical protein
MWRRVRFIARFVPLVVVLLIGAEWPRSYRSTGEFAAARVAVDEGHALSFLSRRGHVDVVAVSFPVPGTDFLTGYSLAESLQLWWMADAYVEPSATVPPTSFEFAILRPGTSSARTTGWRARAPYWALTVPGIGLVYAALFPAWRAFSRRRRGLCQSCGYDLRSSAGRCPECGTEIETLPSDGFAPRDSSRP